MSPDIIVAIILMTSAIGGMVYAIIRNERKYRS